MRQGTCTANIGFPFWWAPPAPAASLLLPASSSFCVVFSRSSSPPSPAMVDSGFFGKTGRFQKLVRAGERLGFGNFPEVGRRRERGEVIAEDGVEYVGEHGVEAYPFTPERINMFKEEEEAAKRNQTIQSVLASPARDYVITNNGDKVAVSELEGKFVGVYFFIRAYCREFTPLLAKMYEKLKEMGERFEVVLVGLDQEESSFKESFASMPWLALPFKDQSCAKLARYFELSEIPTLVMIGADGKTLSPNVAEVIEEHGVEAFEGFPFTEEKLQVLAEKAKAKEEAQTLESLLVTEKLDYVIGKDGVKVPVSELVGKNILLYFSAQWCGPCRAFLPKLIEEYRKIKEKDGAAFEIIFISSDRDESAFKDFYSGMPWLALPLEDDRKSALKRIFKIRGIPSLVAIGPTGRTVAKDAKMLLMTYGADAYPFTAERIKELDAERERIAKEEQKKEAADNGSGEGIVCDGNVCRRV